MILAVDPGRQKAGLVLYCPREGLVDSRIINREDFEVYWEEIEETYRIEKVIIGNGTGFDFFRSLLAEKNKKVFLINEEGSSEEARRIFFQENPPRGLKKLIPRGLLTPPGAIDDYAARVLLYRFLKK